MVVLNQDSSVTIADESIKRKFCFIVSTRYRNYFLQAADQYEMAAWIESIKYRSRTEEKPNDAETSANMRLFNKVNDILACFEKQQKAQI